MGEIATSDRQITLYYNPNTQKAKQTLAYAKAEGLPVDQVDLSIAKFTGTQIVELSNRLEISLKDLVDQMHPLYKSQLENHDLSEDDWIKTIQRNPEIMKQPIALRGGKTILVETPTDILRI
jgi:arsenate reductase